MPKPLGRGRLALLAVFALALLSIGIATRDPAWLRGIALPVWIVSLAGQIDMGRRWRLMAGALALFNLSFVSELRGAADQAVANISIALIVLASVNLFFIWLSRRLFQQAASDGPQAR